MKNLQYIALLTSVSLACSLTPQVASLQLRGVVDAPKVSQTAIVTGQVNLRTNPEGLAQSDVITVLHDGERVTIIQRGETWCKVFTRGGQVGWALCSYLEAE